MRISSFTQTDYRLGWRWLLPYVRGQKLYLKGFNQVEKSFWHNCMDSAVWVEESEWAEGWIVETRNLSSIEAKSESASISQAVQWIAYIGSGSIISGLKQQFSSKFKFTHEYALLPATNSRLVIPLAGPEKVNTALSLHRPGRRMARWGVGLASFLARLKIYFPLRRRVLLVAARSPFFWPMGALQAELPVFMEGEEGGDYALYLGNPDDNRKTVVLPLGKTIPNVIIKIGETEGARRALGNEASALSFLAQCSSRSCSVPSETVKATKAQEEPKCQYMIQPCNRSSVADQVPRVKGFVEDHQRAVLLQEFRPRLDVDPTVLENAVIDFLAQLSTIDRQSRPLIDVLHEMPQVIEPGSCKGELEQSIREIQQWLLKKARGGAEVFFHRSHGDFAPWNCSWTEQGLFVFDWEESRPADLAFSDCFYYFLAPTLHVSGSTDYEHARRKGQAMAIAIAEKVGMKRIDVDLYYDIWLLLEFCSSSSRCLLLYLLKKNNNGLP